MMGIGQIITTAVRQGVNVEAIAEYVRKSLPHTTFAYGHRDGTFEMYAKCEGVRFRVQACCKPDTYNVDVFPMEPNVGPSITCKAKKRVCAMLMKCDR